MTRKLRILLVTRSYPADHDLYQYPFVHRRVRGYEAAGHHVAVFRPAIGAAAAKHRFDGVDCTTGDHGALHALATRFRPDVLAVHGLGPTTWPAIERLARSLPMAAWLHGSEIPGFIRRKARLDGESPEVVESRFDRCSNFWRGFISETTPGVHLVFPSRTAVGYAREGMNLDAALSTIIPNPIDADLFSYRPKAVEQRFNVLLIRPFDSRCYANDLAVGAISSLRSWGDFERFRFRLFGDGPLFEETIEPVQGLANVSIRRGFLTQREIADEHRLSGIFLVPTRLDTQGVSRDEAMSSGLVPVTNSIDPIGEFVDESCAALVGPEDPDGIAYRLATLTADAASFSKKSEMAARRIRSTRSSERIIPLEIELLRGLLDG